MKVTKLQNVICQFTNINQIWAVVRARKSNDFLWKHRVLRKVKRVNVLNNRVYGIYCNVITVHNENTQVMGLWKCGTIAQHSLGNSAQSWVLSGSQGIYS